MKHPLDREPDSRDATESDAAGVAELFREISNQTYSRAQISNELAEWLDQQSDTAPWLRRIKSPDHRLLLIEDSRGLQTMGMVIRRGEEVAYLGGFYSRTKGQGYGGRIYQVLEQQAREWDCRVIRAEVWKESKAQAFFEKRGFEEVIPDGNDPTWSAPEWSEFASYEKVLI